MFTHPLVLASLLAAGLGVAVAMLAVPFVTRFAMSARAVDYPGGRRAQREAIPRMGGIAIALGIIAGAAAPSLLMGQGWVRDVTPTQLAALTLGAALVFLIGLVEDLMGLSPIHRLVAQLAAALGVVYAGWSLQRLFIPLWGEVELGFWGGVVTVVWLVGVTNAINLLDGLDGLAGGVAAIIGTSLLIFAWIQGIGLVVILMSAIVGACLGFLRHNWAPAKIYMGDSGSLTLGFLLAVLSLQASMKGAATVAILVPLLALGLPVIDTLLVMAVRFVERPQGSALHRFTRMFQADRNHVHHLMARRAPDRRQIVLVIYLVAACFCAMALIVAAIRSAALGIALVPVEVTVVLVMRNLGVRRQVRTLSARQGGQIRETFLSGRRVSQYAK